MIIMPLQAGTQWDGFAHCFVEGQMYNGRDMRQVTSAGAQVNGVERSADKVATRGVLLDIPRFKGVPERIREHCPDAKLIYMVRDPIKRIQSHWVHATGAGLLNNDLSWRPVLDEAGHR